MTRQRMTGAMYIAHCLQQEGVTKVFGQCGHTNYALIDASTFDGLAYSIKVGRVEGDNYYVRFSSSGSLPTDVKGPDAERLKKLRERQAREKVLSDYVLLIPKSKLDDTLKPRSELLEKKEEKKK